MNSFGQQALSFDKHQALPIVPIEQTTILLTSDKLSALTGITKRAIVAASARGSNYCRSWIRSEKGSWDFKVINPGTKRPRRRFYQVA